MADAVFLVVPNRQHAPMAVAAAARLVTDGAVGTVVSATVTVTVSAPDPRAVGWRHTDTTEQGGGPLWDVGSHAVDALHRVVGPVTAVSGFLDRTRYDDAAEDSATLLVRFAGGAHGVVQALFTCEQRALEVQGTAGRLRREGWLGRDFAGQLVLERPGRPAAPVPLERTDVFVAQLAELSAAVGEGRPPLVSGRRGRAVVAVREAGVPLGAPGPGGGPRTAAQLSGGGVTARPSA